MAVPLLNRRLVHFLALFECGNFNRAADVIGVSQPALSMSLRQLEEDLGTPLFQRRARGVVPTEAGELLYRHASGMRQSARLATEQIAALGSGALSTLRLGAGVAWTTTVLPEILNELQDRFAGTSIDLVTGVGDQLARHFLVGDVDVILVAGSLASLDAPDIEQEFIANLPMRAVADGSNGLARRARVTPADLVAASWAGFYEDEGFLHLAQHYMALRGLPPPRIAMRTNSAAALAALVRGTDHVTILISPLARTVCETGLVELRLSEPLWEIPVNIYCRRAAANLEAIPVFRDTVRRKIIVPDRPGA